MKIVGHIVFSGDLDDAPDPDAAELALRRAGYTVARPPEAIRRRIARCAYHPKDDWMQALVNVTGVVDERKLTSDVMDEIEAIVDQYGGCCMECGAEASDYWPSFEDLLMTMTEKDFNCYMGGCPECGGTHGCYSIGRDHWYVCHDHRTKWCVGSNLFDSWKDQTEVECRKNEEMLAGYTEVLSLNTHERDGRETIAEAKAETTRLLDKIFARPRESHD